ncbi:hypothetical protein RI049_18185 [Cedecea neteri]|uniref:hypothetical protein n=1 Tax=Cedecea neteri TaxID=158822 RepID=UPI002AA8A7A5|nr:hypothetical protein [Cedecea neteri]WPU21960.1 hypothetical protein RI049_18185 [Cedecea neteri]
MKIKYGLLPALLALSVPAMATQPLPIKVETLNQAGFHGARYATVVVTSRDDSVRVQNIVVNRGNCTIEPNSKIVAGKLVGALPATLEYGRSVRVSFFNNCTASEVTVSTDKGAWRFTYD